MDTARQQRLGYLLRKTAGDRMRSDYISRLSRILSQQVTFLPLDLSDSVREKFFTEVSANENGTIQSRVAVKRNGWDQLHSFLLSLSSNATRQELYVYLSEGDSVGAFALPENVFLACAVSLYREFHETYAIRPGDRSHCIMIDYFDDFYHGTELFEAIFYGEAVEYLRTDAKP